MANITKWTAGSWTSAFGTEINSLAAGSVAVSSVTVTNGTALDVYSDVTFSLTGTTPGSGNPNFTFYLLPGNSDGSTFGDGVASGTIVPVSTYMVGTVQVALNKTSVALTGMLRGIILPPGSYKLAVVNNTSNALSSTGNTINYRNYNLNTNG